MLQETISKQGDSNISLVRPGPIVWKKVAGAVLEVFANVDRPRIHTIYRQRTGCHHCKFRSVVIPLFSWCQGLSPHPGSPHLMRLPNSALRIQAGARVCFWILECCACASSRQRCARCQAGIIGRPTARAMKYFGCGSTFLRKHGRHSA